MAKKKYKGGPDRKSYMKSIAQTGSRPMGQYTKYKDYDPSDVYDSTIDYSHRGREVNLTQEGTDKDVWATELVHRLGKSVNAPFMHRGTLYTIQAASGGGGGYMALQVKV